MKLLLIIALLVSLSACTATGYDRSYIITDTADEVASSPDERQR